MAKRHYIRFLIDGFVEDKIWEVREEDVERISDRFHSLATDNPSDLGHFWFDSVDGDSIVISLDNVLAARYLWEPSEFASDLVRSEANISIYFIGREAPLMLEGAEPTSLYTLFQSLQYGPKFEPYPTLEDEDGELLQLNAKRVLCVVAPKHLISEGEMAIAEEDDLAGDA